MQYVDRLPPRVRLQVRYQLRAVAFIPTLALSSLVSASGEAAPPSDVPPAHAPAEADPTGDIRSHTWDLGVSAGVLLPGEIDLEDPDGEVKTKVSPTFRLILDSYLVPKLAAGLFVGFTPVSLRDELVLGEWDGERYKMPDSGISVLEAGGSLKPRFFVGQRVAIKPGLGFGYRRAFSSEKAARFTGFAVNGSLEVQYLWQSSWKPYVDVGFLTQPYGGVEDVAYVRFGPIAYLTIGMAMGGL